MLILQSMMVLLVFQLAGELVSKAVHIPIPGPVLGMALLAAWYLLQNREPEKHMEQTVSGLLGWLGLLFVPAGVGIVANLDLLRAAWFPVTIALTVSTLSTLLITAAVMSRLKRGRA
ncbi:CidA/LrgA family protein [Edaphobacter sp. HDX4]|uniref:CidA/LrgA family protein n=1 Tax=Edaphobacter sp. HDX4 TaxID=2794064 RepID=UPI002FE5E01C